MNYSFFLFCKLAELIHPTYLEYDVQFAVLTRLYEEYKESGFNIAYVPEYECMEDFLNSKRDIYYHNNSL